MDKIVPKLAVLGRSSEKLMQKKEFLHDVIAGLSKPQKELVSKYFYDARGSILFDQICELDEYYLTRTETLLLEKHAAEITSLMSSRTHLIEFGSGSSIKIRILLDAANKLASYIPVDISLDHMVESSAAIAKAYPKLKVIPVCADFTKQFKLPPETHDGTCVGFFPGSTIGNFTPNQTKEFLSHTAQLLGANGALIIGVDLKKDKTVINTAYNDEGGITAAFNLNILHRINRELEGTFNLNTFKHHAHYNERDGRVEMHLISTCNQTVDVAEHTFDFANQETIHTENSYKYSITEFTELSRWAGYEPHRIWTDTEHLFSIHYLRIAA